MEDKNVVDGSSSPVSGGSGSSSSSPSSSSTSSCRWNPTKEQISMLEGLYRQGIRTPSAEQIQQITSRLKVYGHIEGKNVFYWFQNHKARQRQKQKHQDNTILFLNRFLHKPPPPPFYPPPPPPNNVVCSPFYNMASSQTSNNINNGYNYQQQYPILPGGVLMGRSSPSCRSVVHNQEKKLQGNGSAGFKPAMKNFKLDGMHAGDFNEVEGFIIINNNTPTTTTTTTTSSSSSSDETLALFPLHPTGLLEEKFSATSIISGNYYYSHPPSSSSSSTAAQNNSISSSSSDQSCLEQTTTTTHQHHPLFDFFADQQ